MKSLQVVAAFDWLKEEEIIGTLDYDSIGSGGVFSFEYSREWLRKHPNVYLGMEPRPFPGKQQKNAAEGVFGGFTDSLPDFWGRTLIDIKIMQQLKDEGKEIYKLNDWDYLKESEDNLRTGALRFKDVDTGEFVGSCDKNQVPPNLTIDELYRAAYEVEKSLLSYENPDRRWIERLFKPGSSVGGARPKACVYDGDSLYIAKFPAATDRRNYAKWELFANRIAEDCGIETAKTKIVHINDGKDVFLSRRFDRTPDGRRIHMMSALTFLGMSVKEAGNKVCRYSDISDLITSNGCNVEKSLEELYRRVALNICIGNCDDHLKNHAFLLTKKGWKLSPVYDINPDYARHHALFINNYSDESSLDNLFKAHKDYHIDEDTAYGVIKDVTRSMKYWELVASDCGLEKKEINEFKDRFDFGMQWKFSEGRNL